MVMNPDNKPPCDVCGKPSVGVACSALGAISFSYCARCLRENAEPAGFLKAWIESVAGGVESLAGWFIRGVRTYRGGKYISIEELMRDGEDSKQRIDQG